MTESDPGKLSPANRLEQLREKVKENWEHEVPIEEALAESNRQHEAERRKRLHADFAARLKDEGLTEAEVSVAERELAIELEDEVAGLVYELEGIRKGGMVGVDKKVTARRDAIMVELEKLQPTVKLGIT